MATRTKKPTPTPPRYIRKPGGGTKTYALDDAMIARRDAIAVALGYVKRACSLGATERDGATPRMCWERVPLDYEWRGKKISGFHSVPKSKFDANGCVQYHWPDDAEVAAWAIDKGQATAEKGESR